MSNTEHEFVVECFQNTLRHLQQQDVGHSSGYTGNIVHVNTETVPQKVSSCCVMMKSCKKVYKTHVQRTQIQLVCRELNSLEDADTRIKSIL